MFENKGLVYGVLDEKGNKIGTPIKASAFYNRPTLAFLEQKFKENEVQRQYHKRSIKTKIDLALIRGRKDLNSFTEQLRKAGVHVAVRQNTQGTIYGITFVDHINKTVFNGSDIGKEYGAKALLEKFDTPKQSHTFKEVEKMKIHYKTIQKNCVAVEMKNSVNNPFVEILRPERQDSYVPNHFQKNKKKKKGLHL